MSIVLGTPDMGNGATGAGPYSRAVTVPAGTNRRALIFLQAEASTTIPTGYTVTLGGVTCTLCGTPATAGTGSSATTSAQWYLLDADFPAAGSQTLTITPADGGLQGIYFGVVFDTGVAQTAPDSNTYKTDANTTGTTASTSPVAAAAGSAAWGSLSVNAGATGPTVGATLTESWNVDRSDQKVLGEYQENIAAGSFTCDASWTTNNRYAFAASVWAPAGGAVVGDTRQMPRGTGLGMRRGTFNG